MTCVTCSSWLKVWMKFCETQYLEKALSGHLQQGEGKPPHPECTNRNSTCQCVWVCPAAASMLLAPSPIIFCYVKRYFVDTFLGVYPDGLSGAGRGAATAMMDLLCLTWLIWWRFGIFGRLIWDFYKFLWALTWKIVQIPAFKSCMSCIYHLEQLAHGEASSVSAAAWYLH